MATKKKSRKKASKRKVAKKRKVTARRKPAKKRRVAKKKTARRKKRKVKKKAKRKTKPKPKKKAKRKTKRKAKKKAKRKTKREAKKKVARGVSTADRLKKLEAQVRQLTRRLSEVSATAGPQDLQGPRVLQGPWGLAEWTDRWGPADQQAKAALRTRRVAPTSTASSQPEIRARWVLCSSGPGVLSRPHTQPST